MKEIFRWTEGYRQIVVSQHETTGAITVEKQMAVDIPPMVASEMAAKINTAVFPYLPTHRGVAVDDAGDGFGGATE